MARRFEVHVGSAPASARVVDAAETAARVAAEERGRAAGLAQGEARALAGAVQRLDDAVAEFQSARETADRAVAADAAGLAVSIAREILRVEIGAGRYDLERIVRESLQASGAGRAECVVHLHPRDLERLQGIAFRSATRLEGDPDVAQGDVHVSTARGTIVRDVDAALAAVAERLREDLA